MSMTRETVPDGAMPTRIERSEDGIQIHWSDGSMRRYTARHLREVCPCAGCREKNSISSSSLLTVLRPEELQPLVIRGMHPVGQYAYSVNFSDGHDTGIYTLEMLRGLGERSPLS
ncbi:MAG: DUF971 domain-containing protein [Planctomycetaceae bacterium]